MKSQMYNPGIHIHSPNKGVFNRLEFSETPSEVEMLCGNANCTALLPDMRMGRCGAGAYAHLVPEGVLSEGFRGSRHMFYDLKNFSSQSFWLWRKRYPLDACDFCSFSRPTKTTTWKLEKGFHLFNKEYELEYHVATVRRMIHLNRVPEAESLSSHLRDTYGETAEMCIIEGLLAMARGDLPSSLESRSRALAIQPGNPEAMKSLKMLRGRISGHAPVC